MGLNLDSMKSSHPVEVPVKRVFEISEIFDRISYSKGVSIIRMLENYVGSEAFQLGLRAYLKRHSYANTVTEDLWMALHEASGKPVADVMNTWTKKMGYPVLFVSQEQRKSHVCQLLFSQRRFLSSGLEEDESLWNIPVQVQTESELHSFLMKSRNTTFSLSARCDQIKWIKVNPHSYGFYRVKYEQSMLKKLYSPVLSKSLPPIDRLSLQQDLFALSKAGLSPLVEVFSLLEAYKYETDFKVFSDLTNNLNDLFLFVSNLPQSQTLSHYSYWIRRIYRPLFNNVRKFSQS